MLGASVLVSCGEAERPPPGGRAPAGRSTARSDPGIPDPRGVPAEAPEALPSPRAPRSGGNRGGSALAAALCRTTLSTGVSQRPFHFLAGFVFDESGQPVRGAAVTAYNEMGTAQAPAVTDSRGFFRHDAVHGIGVTSIVVTCDGYVKSRLTEQDLRADQNWDMVRVPLSRTGATLTGQVRGASGTGRADVRVQIFWEHPKQQPFEFWSAAQTTDAEGRFRFEQVPGGALWLVRASGQRTRQELQRLVIEAGQERAQDLLLRGTSRLGGGFELVGHEETSAQEVLLLRVPDGDEPRDSSGELVAAEICDAGRRFVFDHLEAGRYQLRIHLSAELFARREVTLGDDLDLGVLQLSRTDFMDSLLGKLQLEFR